LLKRLFDAGVTLVPGTDNVGGISYHGELEIYQRAGLPGAKVLQLATLVPARVMKEDADYGSIAVGKVADLVIVDGKPTEKISDLRHVERVMRAGRLYKSSDLYSAIGVTRH
jgi:imidazolonepropionase-like amidohydrolase